MTAPAAPADPRAPLADPARARRRLGLIGALLLAAATPLVPASAAARDLGIPATLVPMRYDGVPIGEVFKSILDRVKVQAWVSPVLSTRVTMVLNPMPARDAVDTLLKNYPVVVYQDGTRLYFYDASEVTSVRLAAAAPGEVARQLAGRAGNGNSVRLTKGGVQVTGVAPFIAAAREIAGRVQPPEPVRAAKPPRAARPSSGGEMVPTDPGAAARGAAPAGAPIISPLLPTPSQQMGRVPMSPTQAERMRAFTMAGLPVETAAIAPLSSQLVHAASTTSPMEVRTFTLRWASAADRRTPSGEQVMPGVANKVAAAQNFRYRQTQVDSRQTVATIPGADGNENGTVIINNAAPAPEAQVRTRETFDTVPIISADAATNQIIVTALPSDMPRISALIDQWDVPTPQVELTISIVDVYAEQLEKQGINLTGGLEALIGIFGGSLFGDTGFGVGIIATAGDVAAGLTDLGGQGASRIVEQRTMLLEPGQLDYLRDLNALKIARGGTRGGLDALEAGFMLRVTPHLRGDARSGRIVHLDMQLENSRFTGQSLKAIPEKSSTEFSTSLQIRHGDSMVMVSQSKDVQYSSLEKTAILGDIPVLGWLFKERRNGAVQVRQLMIVTPRVVTHNRGLTPPGRTERKSLSDLRQQARRTAAAGGQR